MLPVLPGPGHAVPTGNAPCRRVDCYHRKVPPKPETGRSALLSAVPSTHHHRHSEDVIPPARWDSGMATPERREKKCPLRAQPGSRTVRRASPRNGHCRAAKSQRFMINGRARRANPNNCSLRFAAAETKTGLSHRMRRKLKRASPAEQREPLETLSLRELRGSSLEQPIGAAHMFPSCRGCEASTRDRIPQPA